MDSINLCLNKEHLERIIKDYKKTKDEIGRDIYHNAYSRLESLKQRSWTKEKYIEALQDDN